MTDYWHSLTPLEIVSSPGVLTVSRLADLLGITVRSVSYKITRGTILAFKLEGQYYIPWPQNIPDVDTGRKMERLYGRR